MRTRPLLLTLALLVTACGGDAEDTGPGGGVDGPGGGTGIEGLASLTVTPADATLRIVDETRARQVYRATGTFDDGHEEDVTDRVSFALAAPGLGSFEGAELTSGLYVGGVTRVLARSGAINAGTGLTLVIEKHLIDPASTLPADPGALFGGADEPARAPTLVYPNDGALVPPNLGRLEVHFRRQAATDVFELAFASPTTDVKLYVSCVEEVNGGCIVQPTQEAWSIVAGSNRGGPPVTVSLRAASAAGGAIGTGATITLGFAEDSLVGGIYYWTTSGDTAIMRYDFAGEQAEAEQYLSTEMTDGECVGCHALSPSGARMVTATNGSYDARSLLLDVRSKTAMAPYGTSRSAFASFAPDDDRYVGTYAGNDGRIDYDLNVFDADTAAALYSIPVGGTAAHPSTHPDWSQAAERIAYVRIDDPQLPTTARFHGGAIWTVDGLSGGTWSPAVELLPALEHGNRYYPTFSPEGSLLAFNQSTCPAGDDASNRCDAYFDPSARVHAMPATGGAPVELAAANAPGIEDAGEVELTNSFPKWAPFEFQRTSEESSRLLWITFSSSRAYGLRQPPGDGTLIWMAAVDPDAVAGGIDPSYPAFALPFQDVATSNHTAQWARTVLNID